MGWGGVKKKFITFLGSSWHFPDFWFFEPLKFPLRPPLVGGGGKKIFYRFSRQFIKFTGLLKFWSPTHPPPRTPPPPPPRGGMGKKMFIDFLGSSWHFPDFWFLDSLKFPLRPPVGGGVNFFFIDFLDSSWNLPDFWNFDPEPPPPPGWDG